MDKSKLEMVFKNIDDKKITLSVDDPRADLTGPEVKTAMDTLVAKNIFDYSGGGMVATVGARLVTTTVEDMAI